MFDSGLDAGSLDPPRPGAITLPPHRASQRVMLKAGLVYQREIVHAGVPHVLYRTPDDGDRQA
jgi:hypothetical protein